MKTSRISNRFARASLAAVVSGVAVLGCASGDDSMILVVQAVVIRLVPDHATVVVGDTVQLVGEITGGSPNTPPSVESCAPSSPNVATAIRSLSGCKVVGLSPGTTGIIVTASTGQRDTATVVVVPR